MDANLPVPGSIDEYIAGFSGETRDILEQIRTVIRAAAPDAEEKISYQMPTFYLNGNLVHFAALKKHIGLYPTPAGVTEFYDELLPYVKAKGSIQFPLDKPIPYDLIGRIVEFRAQENRSKMRSKAKKKS